MGFYTTQHAYYCGIDLHVYHSRAAARMDAASSSETHNTPGAAAVAAARIRMGMRTPGMGQAWASSLVRSSVTMVEAAASGPRCSTLRTRS